MIANLWRRFRRPGPTGPKTVVLHVGAGKTGTSAIQTWLARNRRRLEKHGIHYPQPPEGFALAVEGKITTGNASPLVDFIRPKRRPPKFDEAAFFAWLDGVLRHPAGTILFSSELLPGGDRRKLAELKARLEERGCRIKIVYAVRNAADHVFSKWGQMVKRHGCYTDWDEFSRNPTIPFLRVLESFSAVFGREAVAVINYERSKSDIVRRFLSLVGSTEFGDTRVEIINRSLSARETELMRVFNRAVHRRTEDATRRDALATSLSDYFIYATDAPAMKMTLTGEQIAEFERCVGAIVDKLNRIYLPDEPIMIADPKVLTDTAPGAELSRDERLLMRELAARAVHGVVDIRKLGSDGDCLQAISRAIADSEAADAERTVPPGRTGVAGAAAGRKRAGSARRSVRGGS